MTQKRFAFIISLFLIAVVGCQSKQPAVEQTSKSQDEIQTEEQLKKSMDSADAAYDQELVKKIQDSEKPPLRLQTFVSVTSREDISVEDVERGWMFQQPSFERCYGIAVTKDESAKGTAMVSLKRERGSSKVEMTELTTDIKVEGFEECLKSAPVRWRLSEGSSAKIKIRFETKPGITANDLAGFVPDHRHVDADSHTEPGSQE